MEDLVRHVQPGDPFVVRAATWNKVLESTRGARQKDARPTGGELPDRVPPNRLVVAVRNDTAGGTLAIRNVVQVSYPLEIPAVATPDVQDDLGFSGITPTSANGTPAVVLDGLSAGGIGKAVIMGVCVVSVDITDAAHTRAKLKIGETGHLESGTSGPATILWREEGTGVKLCAVLLCCGTGEPAVGDSPDWVYPSSWWCDGGECVEVAYGDDPPGGATGPYASEVTCGGSCLSPPSVPTTCCPDGLPSVLYVTISGGGGSYPMEWNGATWATGVISVPGCGTMSLLFTCTDTTDPPSFLFDSINDGVVNCFIVTGSTFAAPVCDPGTLMTTTGTMFSTGVGTCSCGFSARTFTVST